jgi:hypothetical protein
MERAFYFEKQWEKGWREWGLVSRLGQFVYRLTETRQPTHFDLEVGGSNVPSKRLQHRPRPHGVTTREWNRRQ